MKLNLKVRFKNPVFCISIITAIVTTVFTYMSVSWESVTTWSTLWDLLCRAISNPVIVVAVINVVWNAIYDPTTKGIGDSQQALTYKTPKE